MILKVTASHIAQGVRNSITRCPVALALAEANNQHGRVGVFRSWAGLCEGSKITWVLNFPEAIVDFITAFDTGQSVEPIECDIGEAVSANL